MFDASALKEKLGKLKDSAEKTLKSVDTAKLAALKDAAMPKRLNDVEKLAALPAKLLETAREHAALLLLAWFAFMALLVFLNIFIRPEHPHFGVDGWFGFWPVFGLGVGIAMVFVMKRIVQPLIVRKEEYYDDL